MYCTNQRKKMNKIKIRILGQKRQKHNREGNIKKDCTVHGMQSQICKCSTAFDPRSLYAWLNCPHLYWGTPTLYWFSFYVFYRASRKECAIENTCSDCSTKTYVVGTQKNRLNRLGSFEHPKHIMLKMIGKKITKLFTFKEFLKWS